MTSDPMVKLDKRKKRKRKQGGATEQESVLSIDTAEINAEIDRTVEAKVREASKQRKGVGLEAEEGADNEKTRKKKKKKDKKGDAGSKPAEFEPTVPVSDQATSDKSVKKGIKQPKNQPELAAVGNRELARSGKAIIKALYKEDPAVAALTSAEVDAWRAERETVVSGCDLRPVMAFNQAGKSPSSWQI